MKRALYPSLAALALGLTALVSRCTPARPSEDRAPRVTARPLRPLPGSLRMGPRPLVSWTRTEAPVTAQFCADRRCTRVLGTTWNRSNRSARPNFDLAAGAVYWRLVPASEEFDVAPAPATPSTPWSPTWSLTVGPPARGVEDRGLGGYPLTAQFDADDDGDTDIVDGDGNVWRNEDNGASFRLAGTLRFAGDRIPTPVGDLNGDGLVDLAVADTRRAEAAGTLWVYLAPLRGNPAEPDATLLPAENWHSTCGASVLGGDLDGDGMGDLVVTCASAFGDRGRVLVYRGTPDGPVLTPSYVLDSPAGFESYFRAIATGDTDGDGADELLVGWANSGDSGFELRSGGRTLDALESSLYREIDTPALPGKLGEAGAVGSLDGVYPQLLLMTRPTATSGCATNALFLTRTANADAGTPSTILRTRCSQAPRSSPAGQVAHVVMGDFDGDGRLDAAWSEGAGPEFGIALARGVSMAPDFGDPPRYDAVTGPGFPSRASLAKLTTADLDDDGVPEILCSFARGDATVGPARVIVLRANPANRRIGPLVLWHTLVVEGP